MKILCDVDSVIIDLGKVWYPRYNKDYDDDLDDSRIFSWGTHEYVKPECGIKIYEYLKDPTLYDDAPEVPGAIAGVNTLKEMGHTIYFLTSGFHRGKYTWLQNQGLLPKDYTADRNYISSYDKSLFCADLLIDDGPHNVTAVTIPAILFDRNWNRWLNFFPRAGSWAEVVTLVQYFDGWMSKSGEVK